jgi:hypothetical protein
MLTKKDRESLELYVYEEYKSAFGMKGRHFDFDSMTDKELKEQASYISDTIEENHELEKEREKLAVKKFEASIKSNIKLGAGDRRTAIRWHLEAEGITCIYAQNDPQYICYELGLPRSKASQFKNIIRRIKHGNK